jgi:DNA replication protein DnaC
VLRKKTFLLLIGPPGTGKTYICAALTSWILLHFNTYRVWKEYDFQKHIRDKIQCGWDAHDTVAYASDDELIIYDDLGSQPVNDWRQEIFFHFVDERYSRNMPTVITSNLSREEIATRYEERVASRLFGKASVIIDLFGSVDLREEFG